ncbi:MAG: FG-GAP repeat protein [Phycisphaerales bacterium]|nr:FG-GAP repeat protein [Phycisphaerales bacterium]
MTPAVTVITATTLLANSESSADWPAPNADPGLVKCVTVPVGVANNASTSIASAGDIDNDGHDDIIVGMPKHAPNGKVVVLSGSDGNVLFEFEGVLSGYLFGNSVRSIGDINADEVPDFVIGAPGGPGQNAGYIQVRSGLNGAVLHQWGAGTKQYGFAMAAAGDINNDTVPDIAVSAPFANQVGAVHIYSGIDGALLRTFNGSGGGFGTALDCAGDVNGDGVNDFIIGAPTEEYNGIPQRGSARVFSGSDGTLLFEYHGGTYSWHWGSTVAGAGDLNSDGLSDFIIGGIRYELPQDEYEGAIVCSGADGNILYSLNGDEVGNEVASAGDVDNDGVNDFLIGTDNGYLNVHSGATGTRIDRIYDGPPATTFGKLAGILDVNNDGRTDFLIAAHPDSPAAVTIVLGVELQQLPSICTGDLTGDRVVDVNDLNSVLSNWATSCAPPFPQLVSRAEHRLTPPLTIDGAELDVDAADVIGDLNQDGFDDVVIGDSLDDTNGIDSGVVKVISGRPDGEVLRVWHGTTDNARFGGSVCRGGDINADGIPDILASGYVDGSGSHLAAISGSDGTILYTLDPPYTVFRSAGDVNRDGHDDLVIGIPLADVNGTDSGSAFVYSGVDGSLIYTFHGNSAGDEFGRSVSGAGDVNGDGYDDIIIGAPHDWVTYANGGSAWVYSGQNGALIRLVAGGGIEGPRLGTFVSRAGDVNADGLDDVIVGSPFTRTNITETGTQRGSASVYLGGSWTLEHKFYGDFPYEHFARVAPAGDVDGDGHDDVVVCSDYSTGKSKVFSGRTGEILYESARFFHCAPGDFNGDGLSDLLFLTRVTSSPRDAQQFLSFGLPSEPCPGDATGDSQVDVNDLNAVLANWLVSCN